MLDDLGIRGDYDHLGGHYTKPKEFAGIDAGIPARYGVVVGLIRNPMDTVVSGYYQCRFRNENFDGPLSDFVASDRHGIERVVRYNLALAEICAKAPTAVLVRYEQMHADAAGVIRCIADLVGARFPHETIDLAASRATFDEMTKREANGELTARYGGAIRRRYPDEPNSGKLRRGKVDGYLSEMSREDIEFCERTLARHDYERRIAEAMAKSLA